jgi:hypothetical protein
MGRVDDLLKKAGISEEEIGKMSDTDIIDLLSSKETKSKLRSMAETVNDDAFKQNLEKKLPELKELLDEPFELFVKKVGAKPSLTFVKIVGYISETSELISYHNGKLYAIKKGDQVNSLEELEDTREKPKPAPKSRSKTNTKK